MTLEERMNQLERMMFRLMMDTKNIEVCESCGNAPKNFQELDLMDQTELCEDCQEPEGSDSFCGICGESYFWSEDTPADHAMSFGYCSEECRKKGGEEC